MLEIILGLCLIFLLLSFVVFLYCAMVLSKNVDEMKRQMDIKNAYFYLIWAIGENYNQYDDTEYTKELINQLVDCAIKGNNNDDTSLFYDDLENNKKYNVLMEEIKGK